jgi:hypothetical protein
MEIAAHDQLVQSPGAFVERNLHEPETFHDDLVVLRMALNRIRACSIEDSVALGTIFRATTRRR